MKFWSFIVLIFLSVLCLASDKDTVSVPTILPKPDITAIRLSTPVLLDGKLIEAEWQTPPITNFTQLEPNEGTPPTEKTDVWIAYDDAALYIAARMHDKRDSIVSRLGRRDAELTSDAFYVGIDSYHDLRTGFYFKVYPSGSFQDGILYNDSWSDNSWDGVWEASTVIDDKGWTAEIRIPYSQLRFQEQDEYIWGINFARSITRKQEEDYFVMVPKKESGWVSRFANLHGIKGIHPPPKIEILPYIVSSIKSTNQFDPDDPFHKSVMYNENQFIKNPILGNFGADVKLGLGSNLTLNATLNPDFGQVEVDPAVVNLSQFETFYSEKRPFFIEGSNFFDFGYGGANSNWGFNWGSPDYFYSRRIGRQPYDPQDHGSLYTDVPNSTTILGAGKLTGKFGDNFSFGGLGALTRREYVEVDSGNGHRIKDVAEPLAFYGVARGIREFDQGKQALGFITTGTLRQLNEDYLDPAFNKGAYAFGMDGWTNLDSSQTWVLTGWGAGTYIEGTTERMIKVQRSPLHYFQRPDADHLCVDSSATHLAGYASRFALNKQKGNVRLNSAIGIISPGFETNDLGYLWRTDLINGHFVTGYSWYEPEEIFRQKSVQIATYRSYDFDGNRMGEGYFMFYSGQFSNYWYISGNMQMSVAAFDRNATRGGPWMKNTNSYYTYLDVSTDSRNDIIGEIYVDAQRSESGGYMYSLNPSLQLKVSSNLSVNFSPYYNRDLTRAFWVTNIEDPTATQTFGNRYIFGMLDNHTLQGDIRMDWTFTPQLSLQLYIQPLISVGTYNHFKELREPRKYAFNTYGVENGSTISYDDNDKVYRVDPDGSGPAEQFEFDNPNFNFKSLRGNAVFRWEYMPGSTLYLVWTRSGTRGNNPGIFEPWQDTRDLITAPDHEDNFLLKITYWITP